jgi:hypothetical protein
VEALEELKRAPFAGARNLDGALDRVFCLFRYALGHALQDVLLAFKNRLHFFGEIFDIEAAPARRFNLFLCVSDQLLGFPLEGFRALDGQTAAFS